MTDSTTSPSAIDAALEDLAGTPTPAHCRPGMAATVGDGIPALVTSIQVRRGADGAPYLSAVECSWWDGCSRRCEWLEPWEVRAHAPEPAPIGFAARSGD